MAQGKSKKVFKGKKGQKRRVVDPFTRKQVYDIKAPSMFNNRSVGKTFVNKTAGTKIASDYLKGRVVETCLAQLQGNEDLSHRKVKLIVEEVQGKDCLTNFYGLDFTRDSLCFMFRKWQTLIQAHIDVDTKDGFKLRLFCIAFTARRKNQQKKTCYAKSSQIYQIRKIMMDTLQAEVSANDLKTVVKNLVAETIGDDIKKACAPIFPLQNVYVRKVKVVKRPRFDVAKLLDLYKDLPQDYDPIGESEEATNQLTRELV